MAIRHRKKMRLLIISTIAAVLAMLSATPAQAIDEVMIKRMEKIINQQQAQMEAQSRAIEKLKQQVQELSDVQKQQAVSAASGDQTAKIPPVAVSSGGDRVAVKLYGQVNRAFLYADDGDSSDYYFVDNSNSASRIGLLGTVKLSDDTTVGAKLEFKYDRNPSGSVSQNNKNNVGGQGFVDRHIDAYVESLRIGKLSVGKGDTASNGTSEVDLSGTSVIGYSGVADLSGGILFHDNNTDLLSGTDVGDVFSSFDGLSRDDRIRYDSPVFAGFKVSASATSGDGGDLALRYKAKFENLKFAAALAWANPNNEGSRKDVESQYSGSASVLHSGGFNLTLAGGQRDYDLAGRDDPTVYYVKLGYRKHLFSLGESRFSIDYARNDAVAQNKDEAESFGLQFVQHFPKWGTEYYLGYRNYDLDRPGTDFNGIDAVMSGLRIKF